MSDRGYIWGKMKQDHHGNKKDIPWKKLLNDKRIFYSTIQSYMVTHGWIPINFTQAYRSYRRISETDSQNLVSTNYYIITE